MTAIAAKLTVGFIAGMTEKGRTETVDDQTEIGARGGPSRHHALLVSVNSASVTLPERNRHEQCQPRDFRIRTLGGQQNGVEHDLAIFKSNTWDRGEERLSAVVALAL